MAPAGEGPAKRGTFLHEVLGDVRWPGLRAVATTTFHARHHLDPAHHFGFYTLIWDRLFGTLAPDYEASFARSQVPPSQSPEEPAAPRAGLS